MFLRPLYANLIRLSNLLKVRICPNIPSFTVPFSETTNPLYAYFFTFLNNQRERIPLHAAHPELVVFDQDFDKYFPRHRKQFPHIPNRFLVVVFFCIQTGYHSLLPIVNHRCSLYAQTLNASQHHPRSKSHPSVLTLP